MAILDEERLDEALRNAICDRMEGWELIEFLNISIEDVVAAFEEAILDNIEDVQEEINYKDETNNDE